MNEEFSEDYEEQQEVGSEITSFPVAIGLNVDKEGLKVSKFQKQLFMLSFEPKNERNYFLISALASKNGSNQNNKGTLLY